VKHSEYVQKQRQDPEYVDAEKELGPILDLADDILALRLAKGWSQADLAEKVGTRQANISRIENGLANPTLKFLHKLARALDAELAVRLRPDASEDHGEWAYVRTPARVRTLSMVAERKGDLEGKSVEPGE
jgi:transcriptional regulator with XRE-family HTH domain